MTPVDQTSLHDPPKSVGNCFRVCLASVMECDIDEIPAFEIPMFDGEEWFPILRDWLAERGLRSRWPTVEHVEHGYELETDMHLIATGPSPRFPDTLHSVVWFDGEIVHDPHPSRAGLTGDPVDWVILEKDD